MEQSGDRGAAGAGEWVVRRPGRRGKPVVRLFCFHHAGGNSSVFNDWEGRFDSRIEVCAVRLPGHVVRFGEALITDAQQMVTAALHGVLPHLDVPFAFFGHSMGALLAYEMTMRLRASGRTLPRLLAVGARPAPDLAVSQRFRTASQLSEDGFLELLREANAATADTLADPDLRKLLMPIVRADFRLCESWQPRLADPLEVPIAAFAGERDPWVPAEAVQRWQLHTSRAFTWRLLPGDHFCHQQCAQEICSTLEQLLLAPEPTLQVAAS